MAGEKRPLRDTINIVRVESIPPTGTLAGETTAATPRTPAKPSGSFDAGATSRHLEKPQVSIMRQVQCDVTMLLICTTNVHISDSCNRLFRSSVNMKGFRIVCPSWVCLTHAYGRPSRAKSTLGRRHHHPRANLTFKARSLNNALRKQCRNATASAAKRSARLSGIPEISEISENIRFYVKFYVEFYHTQGRRWSNNATTRNNACLFGSTDNSSSALCTARTPQAHAQARVRPISRSTSRAARMISTIK